MTYTATIRGLALALALGAAGLTGMAVAAGHERGGPMKEAIESLSLDAATQKKVDAILEKHRAQAKDQFKSGHDTHKALAELNPRDANYSKEVARLAEQAAQQARSRVLHRAQLNQELAGVLSEQQYATLRQKLSEQRGKHRRRMRGPEADGE